MTLFEKIKHMLLILVIEHFSQGLDIVVKATKPLAFFFFFLHLGIRCW